MSKVLNTGPGKGERRPSPPATLLFNFDIGGASLKPEHHDFLRMYVEPVLKRKGSVSIVGLASRTGSRESNLTLSQERADRTLAYLRRQVRTDFNARNVIGYGETKAEREGYPDHTEDPRFRSVILFTSHNPHPPAPQAKIDLTPLVNGSVLPGVDIADKVQTGMDIGGIVLSLLEYAPKVGEMAGTAGGLLSIVSAVAQMPLLWASVHQQNLTNGKLQGFWDALQDMADVYSYPGLVNVPISGWPRLPVPNAHPFPVPEDKLPLNEREWLEGRRQGCAVAYEAVQGMEASKVGRGRTLLFALSRDYGKGVAEAVRNLYDAKLRAMGKSGWPITG